MGMKLTKNPKTVSQRRAFLAFLVKFPIISWRWSTPPHFLYFVAPWSHLPLLRKFINERSCQYAATGIYVQRGIHQFLLTFEKNLSRHPDRDWIDKDDIVIQQAFAKSHSQYCRLHRYLRQVPLDLDCISWSSFGDSEAYWKWNTSFSRANCT